MRPHIVSFCVFSLVVCVTSAFVPDASASWPEGGVAVSTVGSNLAPAIISDGAGGSIITWYTGVGADIFARRLLADGSVAAGWPTTGPLTVCSAAGIQQFPELVSDLAGGALLFWEDARNSNYDVYGLRITNTGQVASGWSANGTPISTAAGGQLRPFAVSDGAGGAIVVWQDGRRAGNQDIYAQRVDADGGPVWASAGVAVCAATGDQSAPRIISDGAQGAYIVWEDARNGATDIYMQRLGPDGRMYSGQQWIADGVAVCRASYTQASPSLAMDRSGGVFVAWHDYRNGAYSQVFTQHVNSGGSVVADWPVDGRPVCQAQYPQFKPVLADDGSTGVFVAWEDYRNGASADIYSQHLTGANQSWAGDGIAVTTAGNAQQLPRIVADGAGGAFISWYDNRGGATNDIYLQRVGGEGTLNSNWDRDGLAVCRADNTQQFPELVSSSRGAATVTWQDLRTGDVATGAIYALLALSGPSVGVEGLLPVRPTLTSARPNPFRSSAQFQLTLPASAFVRAEVLDISGRRVMSLASRDLPAGLHSLVWDGTTARGGRAAPGVYLVRVSTPGLEKTQRVVRLQ